MKCHFSNCGKYLHFANLEGKVVSAETTSSKRSGEDLVKPGRKNVPESLPKVKGVIVLTLFVTTHRLPERKTSRSPPQLIHKFAVKLGKFAGLSLEKLPFTFTWTPEYLYFSTTDYQLNVYEVRLFAGNANESLVTKPRLPVMLPLSASGRQIHYLPPQDGDPRAIVLMGSYPGDGSTRIELKSLSADAHSHDIGSYDTRQVMFYHCPPIGFYLDEEQDMGGWGLSEAETPVERGEVPRWAIGVGDGELHLSGRYRPGGHLWWLWRTCVFQHLVNKS